MTPVQPVDFTPAWVGQPLSWEKLHEIEDWLTTQPSDSKSYWFIEGELELNRGRLEFARRDLGSEKSASTALQARVRAARGGFASVLANDQATAAQKKRATDGIDRADRMLGGSANKSTLGGIALIARAKWGAMLAHPEKMDKNKGGYRRITVHHSAERDPPELHGSVAESAAAVRSIQNAHMNGKNTGYGDIGYHFVIDPFGHVFQGRELMWQGAHSLGVNNIQNIGVCLIGNFDNEKPTEAALDALRKVLDSLRSQYKIPRSNVIGHCDLKSTECPGKYLEPWVKAYSK